MRRSEVKKQRAHERPPHGRWCVCKQSGRRCSDEGRTELAGLGLSRASSIDVHEITRRSGRLGAVTTAVSCQCTSVCYAENPFSAPWLVVSARRRVHSGSRWSADGSYKLTVSRSARRDERIGRMRYGHVSTREIGQHTLFDRTLAEYSIQCSSGFSKQ